MSVSKDARTGKWMVQRRISDWQGNIVNKKKRGFATKKEAQEWERQLLSQGNTGPAMPFRAFIELYFEDMKHRLRESTLETKRQIVDTKILPFLGPLPLNRISAPDVRKWQNTLTSHRDRNGQAYSQTYLKAINNQLTALFNYAVKYCELPENPCHKAGNIGRKYAGEMLFWTKDEFDRFIFCMKDRLVSHAAFMTLYYTGMRIGELQALTTREINLEDASILIDKSFLRINRRDVITPPKTPRGARSVTIPRLLCECLQKYLEKQCLPNGARVFPFGKHFLPREMILGCQRSGVKRIRIHDLRHSHASLLIEMNFSPRLIADRLGHEKIQTTLDIYSHLYPDKQTEVAKKLDALPLKQPDS